MNFDQNIRCVTLLARVRRWANSLGIVALLACLTASPAMAGAYDGAMGRTNYVVMMGDVNGDGKSDVLMKAVPKIVLIPVDDDLSVPVPIPVPSPSFALISISAGYTLVVNPSADILGSAAWLPATQQVTFTAASGTSAGSVTISAVTNDQASFVVSMAAASGQLELSSTTMPVSGGNASSATPIAVNVAPPHLTNADAGTLPGSLGVSASGAATYGIDIVVPPGTAGVQPAISLGYSSTGTNGTLGVGWSLGGFSAIGRCGKTMAQDGVNSRISFNNADRLCLDGQRLVLVNLPQTDDNYWASTAEYRTEIESFSRITVQMVNGKRSFKVESKNGHVSTYGSTVSSYVKGYVTPINGGTGPTTERAEAQSWAIDQTLDASGNYIRYAYSQNPQTGEHLPTEIRYGGTGLPSHAAVKFTSEGRTDAWTRYIDETRNDLRSRISHVTTYVGENLDGDVTAGSKVRDYALTYDYSPTSGRSTLASVEVCATATGSTTTTCLPKTTFAWGKPDPSKPAGFVSQGMWAGAPILTKSNSTAGEIRSEFFTFMDFDLDGRTDAMEMRVAPPMGTKIPALDGMPVGTVQNHYRYFHNDGTRFVEYSIEIDSGLPFVVLSVGDFNGDGAPDIVIGDRVCLSPLGNTGALGAPGSKIIFTCDPHYKTSAYNHVAHLPYLVDVVGDGRVAQYSPIDKYLNATLCSGDKCVTDYYPPPVLSVQSGADGTPEYRNSQYTLHTQMVDFTGIGKPYDVRWSVPKYTEYTYDDGGATVNFYNRWDNLQPTITITGFNTPLPYGVPPPDNVPGTMNSYAYRAAYSSPPLRSSLVPYVFDVPAEGGGLTADFSGSGYSALAFGFLEIVYPGSPSVAYTRTDLVICLSTGRSIDCKPRKKYSGANYRAVTTIDNFIGDGTPSILTQRMLYGSSSPYKSNDLEMCHVSGDDATDGSDANAANDSNMVCEPWGGATLNRDQINDRFFYMDLLGTGRTQLVKYHGGYVQNGVWVEDGRWEVFAPRDRAVDKQALDRIYQVTNGIGSVASVEYADGVVSGAVTNTRTIAATYPRHLTSSVGKIVTKLITDNGASAARSTSYAYQDRAIDVAGRGTLGFAVVTSTDEQTKIKTRTSYRQDWPFSGMTTSAVTTQSDNSVLSTQTSTLAVKLIPQANGTSTVLPVSAISVAQRFDIHGEDLGTVTTTGQDGGAMAYDDWGNQIGVKVSTAGGGQTFTSVTANSYWPADTVHWVPPLLKRRDATRTTDTGSAITRSVTYDYEPDYSRRVKTETVQPNDLSLSMKLVTDYTHNGFGLVKDKTVTWWNPKTLAFNVRKDSTGYDAKGRVATLVTNALLQSETRTYDYATGAVLTVTGPNNLTSHFTNDAFGRVQVTLGADGNEVRQYVKKCQGDCPVGAVVVNVTDHFNGSDRIAVPQMGYADSAGHVLRTATYGFDGRLIVADQRYDELGRAWQVDQPRFEADESILAQENHYDILNRVFAVDTRREDGTTVKVTTSYQGMTTVVTNARLQPRTDLHDVLGRAKQVTDAALGVTSFTYDAWDNLKTTTDPRQNVISVDYNDLGRRTALRDPDLGFIEYFVDAAGQTWKQINPVMRAASTFMTTDYDILGRMTVRTEPDLESHWTYDPAMGIGQLGEAYTGTATAKDYRRTHTYDSLGRPSTTTQVLRDGTYTSTPQYDAWGRLITTTHVRGTDAPKVFDQRYNGYGYLNRIYRGATVLWQADTQDASSRVLQATLGNGLVQTRVYNQYNGRLTDGLVVTAAAEIRLQEGYFYDEIGNVSHRDQHWYTSGFGEDFTYDNLNRLFTSQVTGQSLQQMNYLADGSILNKTGVGTGDYQYPELGQVQRHAVHSIAGIDGVFVYDADGNLKSGNGRTADWTTFDMPVQITKGSSTSSFVYGPEHQRTLQTRGGTTIVYAGAQEVETTGTQVTVKTYWPNGLGVEIDKPGAATDLEWTHHDRLGSPVALSGITGVVTEPLAYDAWGKRRTINGAPMGGTATSDSIDGVVDNKGFTGHEMLDQLDLVHMNGRVYDPMIGKFLSGDPFVQDPVNGQNYNRYSYVLNNPTNLTDPTGFQANGPEVNIAQGFTVHFQSNDIPDAAGVWANEERQTGGVCTVAAVKSGTGQNVSKEGTSAVNGKTPDSANRGAPEKNYGDHYGEYLRSGAAQGDGASTISAGYDDWARGKGYMTGDQWSERAAARGLPAAPIGAAVVLVTGAAAVVEAPAAAAGLLAGIKKFLGLGQRALSKSEDKAIQSLKEHIAEHEKKIIDFKNNPTVRPGMENLPEAKIAAQQARRLEHLQQEIDAARKNIQDILNGTSNAGK